MGFATIAISFVLLLLVVLGMAVGVIAGRPAIKGSCGGLNNGPDGDCPLCGGGASACKEEDPPTLGVLDTRRKP